MKRRHTSLVCLIACVLAPAGCQRPAPAPLPPEPAVRADLNEEFKGDVKVEQWVERFEGESREIYRERERILDAVGLTPGMAVADIGAGTGFFTHMFARRVGSGGRVYAVDIAPEFLDHIEATAAERGMDNIVTVLADDASTHLPPNSIDRAFICDTYHHFEQPLSTMRSLHRAVRRGGEVIVVDFRRIPGVSRQWVLDHVRAGEEETTREIESCGFERIDTPPADYLDENYLIRFRKRE